MEHDSVHALGALTMHTAQVEYVAFLAAQTLSKTPIAEFYAACGALSFETHHSMCLRLLKAQSEPDARLLAWLKDAKDLVTERNRVVHTVWRGPDEPFSQIGQSGGTPHRLRDGLTDPAPSLDRDVLRQLALRASNLATYGFRLMTAVRVGAELDCFVPVVVEGGGLPY